MKTFAAALFSVSAMLAVPAFAEDADAAPHRRHSGDSEPSAPQARANAPAAPHIANVVPRPAGGLNSTGARSFPQTPRNFAGMPPRQIASRPPPAFHRDGDLTAVNRQNFGSLPRFNRPVSPAENAGLTRMPPREVMPAGDRTFAGGRDGANFTPNFGGRTADPTARGGRDGQWRGRHRDWQNRNGDGAGNHDGIVRDTNNGGGHRDWNDARRHYHHDHHDRDWWCRHYTNIVLISGGYYYWDRGWWYPAWGYDPYYTNYTYDGPLYGYDYSLPDQTIADVQGALREEGYYLGEVDGQLGRLTQQAIAAWQRDHGLAITTAVDYPTLRSLGLA